MRIAIVSDFHGNLAALDEVVADVEREAADLRESGYLFPEWLEDVQKTGRFWVPE